jgi:hypothetical protein
MEQKKGKKKATGKKVVAKNNKSQKKVEVTKVVEKPKDNSTKYLCLFVIVIAFTFAFMLLIDKQNNNYMNDIHDGGFSVTPEVGKVIVARDMDAIYPKYYVVYTTDDSYSIYVYNYYETVSQYELEYNRLIDSIVDYNEKDRMIRYLYDRGYGTYNEVLNNLSMLVNSSNLKIY